MTATTPRPMPPRTVQHKASPMMATTSAAVPNPFLRARPFLGPVMSAEGSRYRSWHRARAPDTKGQAAGDGSRRRPCGSAGTTRPRRGVRAAAGRSLRRRGVRWARRASTMGRSHTIARANRSRRRWPAETDVAPPVITVDSPSGRLDSQSSSPTARNAAVSSPSVASPRATSRLSRTVVSNRCASSAKNPAVKGLSCSAAIAISIVVLPHPLGPTTATRSPRRRRGALIGGRSRRRRIRRGEIDQSSSGDAAPGQLDRRRGKRGGRLERRQWQQDEDGQGGRCDHRRERDGDGDRAEHAAPIAATGAAAPNAAGSAARSAASPQSPCLRDASAITSSMRPATLSSGACSSASSVDASRPE